MAYYPLVGKNDRPVATTGHRSLPTFYMEDFSIVGFRVNDCDQAVQILDRHAFPLKQTDGCIAVDIAQASHVLDVMQLLNGNGLECEMADIAEGMYQG